MGVLSSFRVLALAGIALSCTAQQPSPIFDVAVIRSNHTGATNTQMDTSRPGQFIAVNATARTLLRNAYGLLPFQLVGAPKWDDEDGFDIRAKTAAADPISPDTFKLLLQGLLAERFHLKAHWETREASVYVLTLDKGAQKIAPHPGATPATGMNTRKTSGSVLMRGSGVAMDELSTNLANQLGRYVVNRTGLEGTYDFTLNWGTDQNADTTLPTLFTALREQAGLRLEVQKGTMPVLVVDELQKPTDN
jgi:uncharacterized protein (TIGR03435 family)